MAAAEVPRTRSVSASALLKTNGPDRIKAAMRPTPSAAPKTEPAAQKATKLATIEAATAPLLAPRVRSVARPWLDLERMSMVMAAPTIPTKSEMNPKTAAWPKEPSTYKLIIAFAATAAEKAATMQNVGLEILRLLTTIESGPGTSPFFNLSLLGNLPDST